MNDTSSKQYIIKQSNGRISNFFYKENAGICYRVLGKKGTWLETSVIVKDSMPNFSICQDDNDSIHILCQDRYGNIIYWFYNNGTWSSMPILNSKSPAAYDKHLNIVCTGKTVYFFYVLEYAGNRLLSFQYKSGHNSLSKPKVIDYIEDSADPYITIKDSDSNLLVFYRYADEKFNQIGYKCFSSSKGLWSEFLPASDHKGEGDVLSAAADRRGDIHMYWQRAYEQKYEILYSVKKHDSESFSEAKVLYTSNKPFKDTSMAIIKDRQIVYWIEENTIYHCISSDGGLTWSEPSRYSFYMDRQLSNINYIINPPSEHEGVYFTQLPGSLHEGFKLPFINDTVDSCDKLNPDELKLMISDTLKSISDNIEQLKQAVKQVNEKIELINSKLTKHDGAFEKNGSKTARLELELAAIKSDMDALGKTHESRKPENISPMKNTPEAVMQNSPQISPNVPLMPGTGFSSITPEYLKGLAK